MSTEALTDTNDGLLFNWRPSRRRKLSLFGFITASVALHALCFYLFQIVYPPPAALLPPPGRVSVISPVTEDGRILLRWIEAEDPALAAKTQRAPDTKTFTPPRIAHVPSFATHRPALRDLPPYLPDLRAPEIYPPGPVPRSRSAPATPAPPAKTAIAFADDAAALRGVQTPEMRFTRSTSESPQPAEFRVAISPAGDVRYCFLQTSSGDAALDEQARQYLALCRFPEIQRSAARDLIWTSAVVTWGSDLIAPKAAPP